MVGLYTMVTLNERHDPVKLMLRRLLIIFLACLVLSALWAVWNISRKDREAARLRAESQAQLADLKAREAKLQADYEKLKTVRGKEEALREQYAVGKSGEGLIVIVEPDKPKPVQATTTGGWLKNMFSW